MHEFLLTYFYRLSNLSAKINYTNWWPSIKKFATLQYEKNPNFLPERNTRGKRLDIRINSMLFSFPLTIHYNKPFIWLQCYPHMSSQEIALDHLTSSYGNPLRVEEVEKKHKVCNMVSDAGEYHGVPLWAHAIHASYCSRYKAFTWHIW